MKSLLSIIFLLTIFNVSYSSEYKHKKINIDNIEREFFIKYPSNYDAKKEYPLIIALHGGGSDWEKFNRKTTKHTLAKSAEAANMIIIFPQGKDNYWNDGRKKHLKGKEKYNDIKFISNIIEKSIKDYSVSADKVFITGISNGGFMAIRLAMDMPDKIAAVAAVSAQISLENKNIKISQPISFLLINGDKDPIVPYDGGEMKLFKNSKSRGTLLSTQQTVNTFVKANKCNKTPIVSTQDNRKFDNTSVTLNNYENCQDSTQVKLITLHGGGHTWPGGKQYLPVSIIGKMSKEINASNTIVNFFLQNIK